MQIYGPSYDNDVALVHWWQELVRSGDIASYPDEMKVMSCFLAGMQEPTTLLCESDQQGLWLCFWYRPSTLPFAIINLWIRHDHRGTKGALNGVFLALTEVFHHHQTVVAYCGDRAVAALYEKFGMGRHTPDIYIGEHQVTVFSLTRDQFHHIEQRRGA